MTVATLLSAATQPGFLSAPVALPAVCPSRFRFDLTMPAATNYGQATVLGTVDGQTWVQVWVAQKAPNGQALGHYLSIDPNYVSLRASVDNIQPGVGASMTLTVTY